MNKRYLSNNVYTNSKHNRYTQQTPSTSNNASTSTSKKFTIEQNIPTNKLGSNNVKQSIDTNKEIVIPRRFGEGIKPIFNRQDVQVNSYKETSNNNSRRSVSLPKKTERRKSSSSSCSSSSRERYRPKTRHREKSISPIRKKTPDKVPYFADTKRELDRLRTKVDVTHSKSDNKHITESHRRSNRSKSPSRSYDRKRKRSRSPSRERYRSESRSSRHRRRSRSHSRDRNRYYRSIPVETQYIPVPVPMEFSPFAPRWIHPVHPMIPYTFPRYHPPYGNVIRPPPSHFPIHPNFPPRMGGYRFQRPQRGRNY